MNWHLLGRAPCLLQRHRPADFQTEMLMLSTLAVPASSSAVQLVQNPGWRCRMPVRNLLGGFKRGEKKGKKMMHKKEAGESHIARQAGVTCASEATEEAYWPQVRWCGQAQRGGQRRQQHPCGRARRRKGCCLCPTDRRSSTGPRSSSGTGCLCPVRLLANTKPPVSARGFVLHGAHLRW